MPDQYTQIDLSTLNIDTLVEAVDTARAAVARKQADGDLTEQQATHWQKAISQAYDYLLTSDDTILVGSDGSAFIPSASETNTFHHANGTCSCKGFTYHGHCWHQAAARLIKRYREREQQQRQREVQAAAEQQRQRREAAPLMPPGRMRGDSLFKDEGNEGDAERAFREADELFGVYS
jgi:hypothetical protein